MLLDINHTYILYVEFAGRQLTYTATIIECDDKFVKFKDKYGETATVAVDTIKQIKEVTE